MTRIFVVTSSALYYPQEGSYDWLYAGPDWNKALRAYNVADEDKTYLIEIKESGWVTLYERKKQ